jgi:hypothetical protein
VDGKLACQAILMCSIVPRAQEEAPAATEAQQEAAQ